MYVCVCVCVCVGTPYWMARELSQEVPTLMYIFYVYIYLFVYCVCLGTPFWMYIVYNTYRYMYIYIVYCVMYTYRCICIYIYILCGCRHTILDGPEASVW